MIKRGRETRSRNEWGVLLCCSLLIDWDPHLKPIAQKKIKNQYAVLKLYCHFHNEIIAYSCRKKIYKALYSQHILFWFVLLFLSDFPFCYFYSGPQYLRTVFDTEGQNKCIQKIVFYPIYPAIENICESMHKIKLG